MGSFNVLRAALVFGLLFVSGTAGRAETVVVGWIGGNPGTYRLGTKLADDPHVDIPGCKTLVVRYRGQLAEFPGPYRGRLSAYKEVYSECRLGLDERKATYGRYYRDVCERSKKCDELCRMMYNLIDEKNKVTLKCP
jgi:hypothetical protein